MAGAQRLQQLHTLDNEVEYNEALIEEREEELRNIERSIVEVNEIFRDLGTIVNEQQYMLGKLLFIVVLLPCNDIV
jgi:syntaxin 7